LADDCLLPHIECISHLLDGEAIAEMIVENAPGNLAWRIGYFDDIESAPP
jgi:hypothetical protein